MAWLLAPLFGRRLAGALPQRDPRVLAHRAAIERVTATLGLRIEGVRELGRPG